MYTDLCSGHARIAAFGHGRLERGRHAIREYKVGTKEGTDEQKGCIYVSKVHLRTKLLGNAWHLRRGSLKSSLEAGWSLDSFSTDVLYGSMFCSK